MIKVGIIGVGHLGEIHLKLILSSTNFNLIGFYETNQEKSNLISFSDSRNIVLHLLFIVDKIVF